MKKALIFLFLFSSVVVNATTYYVATSGKDSYPGTISQPFGTWNYAMNKLKAGDILYVRGGTYTGMLGVSGSNAFGVRVDGVNGTASNHITVTAYNGEVPVLDGSSLTIVTGSNVGIILNSCSYWDFTGLVVMNFAQHSVNAYSSPGWVESNCSNITHTNCTVHDCGDGYTLWGTKDYIYYKNCDSYQNCDHMNDAGGEGGLANGFASGVNKGEHVYYEGCRAWMNSDDGWDAFNNNGGSGYIQYINCWAFKNGAFGGVSGDGSGFKLGVTVSSADGGVQRILRNCISVSNTLWGYDQNDGGYGTIIPITIFNSISSTNKGGGFNFRNGAQSTIRNCISLGETLGNFGSNTVDHNSWQNSLSITVNDFTGNDVTELTRSRKADGSLPDINYMHLASGSRLIDAGTDVGIAYNGKAPDIGAFEVPVPPVIPNPLYVSSSVENATPSLIEMTFNLALNTAVIPDPSSFSVLVNSVTRKVVSVGVSGLKIQLSLESAVKFGDIITLSYTKPASNAIQTPAGGQAVSITSKLVTNNCKEVAKTTDPPVVILNYPKTAYAGFINEIDASGSYDPNNDTITATWTVPSDVPVSSNVSFKTEFLAPFVSASESVNFTIRVSDGKTITQNDIPIVMMPYKPELHSANIVKTEESDFQSRDYSANVLDDNTDTKWSSDGNNKWMSFKLGDPFSISHIVLAFLKGQQYISYFDIYASKDNINWDHILVGASSCKFSGAKQVFDFPTEYENIPYTYVKYIGHGNSVNTLNTVSELKIFGVAQPITVEEKPKVLIYPNPARDFFYFTFKKSSMTPKSLRIIDASGNIVSEIIYKEGMNRIQIPDSLNSGLYIVQFISGGLTIDSQKLIVQK